MMNYYAVLSNDSNLTIALLVDQFARLVRSVFLWIICKVCWHWLFSISAYPSYVYCYLVYFFSQSGTGSCLLIQCQNSSCSRSFHTFCLDPPLQDVSGTWECFLCKINQASLAKATEVYPLKKIQKLVGHRRVILQESDFQYQFLVKWQLLSHIFNINSSGCWISFCMDMLDNSLH